jgi:hypothetical protein
LTQVLQVQPDAGGTNKNIGETTESDPAKYGARVVDIDARTKLEAIRVLLASGVNVSGGTVALDASSLAALETINAIVAGTVALDAASLAALETVNVANMVPAVETGLAKDATLIEVRGYLDTVETKLQSLIDKDFATQATLATRSSETTLTQVRDYLDTVETKLQSLIDNTDGLEGKDFATQATLLQVRDFLDTVETKLQGLIDKDFATQVTLSEVRDYLDTVETRLQSLLDKDFATQATLIDLATQATLADLLAEFRNKYDVVLTARDSYETSGDHTLLSIAAPDRLRTTWLYAQAKGVLDTGVVTVIFTLGTNSYEVELTGSQPFAHSAVWEGAAGEDLIVNTSSTAAVIVNVDYRLFS